MESFDSDDYLLGSVTSDESNDSDFSFNSDELVDDLQELRILDEFSNESQMDVDPMTESHTDDNGFTMISSNDTVPMAIFKSTFTEVDFHLIVEQTNIYGRQKFQRKSQNTNGRWTDVGVKDIELFFGMIIVMGISDLLRMKLYWSKDNFFA